MSKSIDEYEITVTDFINLANNYQSQGLFECGKAFFRLANEYAEQRAIQFKEWQDNNLEESKWENYDGYDTWINPVTRQVKTTEQLWNLFLEQTQNK